MAPQSSTLAWKIPWMEEPGGLRSMGSQRVGHDWATSLSCIREGNGNPLQCSCLENPRDGGAWWAAVYGVAQNRTRLKQLSRSSSSSSKLIHDLKHKSCFSTYITSLFSKSYFECDWLCHVNDIGFFLFFLIFKPQTLYWFCQTSKRICHRETCAPHPEPSSLLSPHTILLGRPSAPAPSIQYCASNLDWQLISYMMLHMFQCHSPKSSHPLPLPQSP